MTNHCWSNALRHRIRSRLFASGLLLLLPGAMSSPAQTNLPPGTLAVREVSSGGGCLDVVDNARVTFGYCPNGSTPVNGIFGAFLLTTNDVGRIIPISAADDTNFVFTVSILTNGASDFVGVFLQAGACGSGEASLEAQFFSPLPPGGNSIDFGGFQIDNIALEVEELTFAHTGYWTDVTGRFRLYVNSVPWARPTIVRPPQNQLKDVGSTVDFAVSAAGNPPLGYQWFFNATNLIDGATNSLLELVNIGLDAEGAYTVVVTNRFGAVTSSPALLTITPIPPNILTPPASQTAIMGSTVDLAVSAGGAPPPAYQWFFNETNPVSGGTNSVLQLVSVQPAQQGTYTVVISNAVGGITSPPAILTIQDLAIASQPASQLVVLGGMASLSVVAAGTGPLAYQWYKDGAQLTDNENISGAQAGTLTLAKVLSGDTGSYFVVVSNPRGSVTSAMALVNTTNPHYSVLHEFTGGDAGYFSLSGLIAAGSTLYGATCMGGDSGQGTVFKVNSDGTGYTLLKKFRREDGIGPMGDLLLADSSLYGTAYMGGSQNHGTAFRMSTDGNSYNILHQFNSDDGMPEAGFVLSGATLYGFTVSELFNVNIDGSGYVLIKRFTSNDGFGPSGSGSLVLSGTTLYGASQGGPGLQQFGAVFKLLTDGSGYTVLKSFAGSDGDWPYGGLVLSGTMLYGTTYKGGAADYGTVFKLNIDGSGFTVLKHFSGADGANPAAGLVVSGATLYGTTFAGGATDNGTVFQINTDGSQFAVLKSFTGDDGSGPEARLALSGGTLYGTTAYGGASGGGVVFAVSIPPSVTIDTPPADQTAEAGGAVEFQVVAIGKPLLTYQWFFNGTNSLGAATTNAFLRLTNLQPAQAGVYSVVAANGQGSLASASARLSVTSRVERRWVPGISLSGQPGGIFKLEAGKAVEPTPAKAAFDHLMLMQSGQWYFDLSAPFPGQRFFRGTPTDTSGALHALEIHMIPALTLSGPIGGTVRIEAINQFGPTDAWFPVGTVTLTKSPQLYFDTSVVGQPHRLWRILPPP